MSEFIVFLSFFPVQPPSHNNTMRRANWPVVLDTIAFGPLGDLFQLKICSLIGQFAPRAT